MNTTTIFKLLNVHNMYKYIHNLQHLKLPLKKDLYMIFASCFDL